MTPLQATVEPAPPIEAKPSLGEPGLASILSLAALLGIVLLALALRWDRLQYAEFTSDQAWAINRAYDLVVNGYFPLTGLYSSARTFQGPYEIYLLAMPVAFSRDPLVASGYVGLLQVLAIVGTYLLVSRYFGRPAALIAAALYAVNPWALQYARKIWTPDLPPLFTVLFFSAVYAAVVQKRRYRFSLACLWLAVLLMLHPSTVVFAPVLLVVLLAFWRRMGLRPLLLGAFLALIVASPYLYSEYRGGFASLKGYLGVSTAASQVDLEAWKYVTTMATARFFPNMMGYGFRGSWQLPDLALANDLGTWLLFLGLALCAGRLVLACLRRGRQTSGGWERYALLLLWFAAPVVVSARHSLELFPHYFVAMYPAQFILIALALVWVTGMVVQVGARLHLDARRPAAVAAAIVVLYFTASQALFFHQYVDVVERNGPTDPYGVPLAYSEQAVATLRALRAETGYPQVQVYSYLQQQALDYLGRPDLSLLQIDPPAGIVLPDDRQAGAILMLASDEFGSGTKDYHLVEEDGPMVKQLLQLGFAEVPERTISGPDGYVYYRFFTLRPGATDDIAALFTRPPRPLFLANGMRLVGYSYLSEVRPGDKATVRLLWEMPTPPERAAGKEYNLFAHLVDGAGQVVDQRDSEVYQNAAWHAGDLFLSFYDLAVPAERTPGLLWLDLGAYSRFDRTDVPWLGENGATAGSASRLGPLVVRAEGNAPAPQRQGGFLFGNALYLEGYDLDPREPAAGDTVRVALHWQARSQPAEEYVISVQLLDESGKLVAQQDSPPLAGDYPTSYWQAGETVVDRHDVALPAALGAGDYSLVVVVYRQSDQQRLAVSLADGTAGGDFARVGTLSLRGSGSR